MKVLACADHVGSLAPSEVVAELGRGWRSAAADTVVERPLSDGGRGLLSAVAGARPATRVLDVTGPAGDPVRGAYLVTEDGTAWIEAAQVAGLHLVPGERRDPTRTTSRGVGELMAAAVAGGAPRLVVGVNDAAACDGGAGMLDALGARATPSDALVHGGRGLGAVQAVDLGAALAALAACTLEFATDVDIPLTGPRGVARGFAAGQGADCEQVQRLEAAMTAWVGLLGRAPTGRRVGVALGSGAGGGLGAALYRLGARRIPGIATVLAAAGISEQCADADLVLCAVDSLDAETLRGSVVSAVAQEAMRHALPVIVLAGRLDVTRRQWITAGVTAAFQIAAKPGCLDGGEIGVAAQRVARTWSR